MLLAVQALCDALAKRIKLWSLRAHLFEVIVKASNQGSSIVIRRWLTSRGFCTRPIYRSSQTVEPGGYATTLDRFVTKFKRLCACCRVTEQGLKKDSFSPIPLPESAYFR